MQNTNFNINNQPSPIDNIPDIDTLIKQVSTNNQNFNANDYFSQNVAPLLNEDVQRVLYGNVSQAQQAPQATQAQPVSQSQSGIVQPYADRAKNYKYKRFYGDTPNGFDAVDMNSMGLKGRIWSGNSVPFIRKEYTDAMHWLDDKLSSNGVKIIYTSAMGGKHQQSSSGRGHGDGAKLDAQGVIPPNLYRELYNRRYFGEGTGAIGYEVKGSNKVCTPDEYEKLYKAGKITMANGNHYDFSNKYASEYLAIERRQNTNPLKQDDTAIAFAPSQTPSQSQQTQGALPIDQLIAYEKAKRAQQTPQSSMNEPTTNLATNALNDIRELGTGLTYLWANKGDLLANAPKAVNDYLAKYNYNPIEAMGNAAIDVANLMLSTYNIDLRTLGDRNPANVLQGVIAGIYSNPVEFLLDFISFGGAGVAKKLIEKTPGLAKLANAGKVEKAIAAENKTLAQKGLKAEEKLAEVNKLANEAGISTEQLLKAAEEGKDILPKGEKTEQLWSKLKDVSDDFDELARVYSPSTYVGKERTAIIQKILRDREFTQPGITYEQIRREVTPYLDELDKLGIDKFAEKYETLAEQNHLRQKDIPALEVLQSKRAFDSGDIMPITHMMAEVDKSVGKEAIRGARAAGDIEMTGRFSNRAYGNATYKAIAEQWAKPQEYLTNLMDSYLEGGIASAILRGEFAPVAEGVKKFGKASYLDRELLEQGKLREAIKNARKEPTLPTDIAIDNDMLAPLKSQVDISGGAFSGGLKQAANTAKGTMLSTGQYLGPNLITGTINALMNSGPMIVGDIVSAIKSKGQLAKNLGVYRYEKPAKISNILGLREIDKLNNWWGGRQMRRADRAIQNMLAEIAGHAELRRKGIPFKDRFKAIDDMDKIKLGEVITNTKRSALINSPKTLLPDMATDALSIINPFWRWTDTATQATYNLLKNSPVMSNILLCDIMGSIAFDKEMQNRLNLNVDMDKPYVTFKPDPNKPDRLKAISAEFVPMTTTLKFVDPITYKDMPPQFALFNPIIKSLGGLDRYGRPMKRPDQNGIINQVSGTKRYQAGNGQPWHEVGGQWDEMLNTAIKTFIGPVNLYNRTIAPMLAPVLSPTGQYYQPYGMSTFGSYDRNLMPDVIQSANPKQGRTARDVINAFTGIYEKDYNPEYEQVSPRQFRGLTRGYFGNQIRLQNEGY